MDAEFAARQVRNPLLDAAGWQMFRCLHEHPQAPHWNYQVGDRLQAEDLPALHAYRQRIARDRPRWQPGPPDWLLTWIERLRPQVPLWRERLPAGFDLRRDWVHIPTTCREDIASRIEHLVPQDAELSRLIVYETNGTSTGHALDVPNHPAAVALNHPLLEFALARHGVRPQFDAQHVACVNVGAEARTVTFATVFAAWNNAGFAKINLHEASWTRDQASRFFAEVQPEFLTGDPVAFAAYADWAIDYQPKAFVSTATCLSEKLRQELHARYGCPVIDFYSTTETGPIAYAGPADDGLGGDGFSQLPPDLYLEVLDPDGDPAPTGELGEISVSGGRNPYLPLLRYRTGDYARLEPAGNPDDPAPRLLDLHARQPVLFRALSGAPVHPLDIAYVLRTQAWVQHELLQRPDGSLRLTIRPGLATRIDRPTLYAGFEALFGKQPLEIIEDPELGGDRPGGKVLAYRSEMSPV
ncbi:AMP-binding protein [Thiorhodovibrio frisius]|uniref:Coenzyme F390 synthetase n=1 Tax=Thiorhodovibrio frisius TaxID=631362 RepID=H8Z4T8_9GAMM|nr:AMP-binding protein [Thiorhodovibrio frisius]EIC20345.1 coenzyme F390 synthetase [Thiorhodovibrio frisius]WPL21083.1 phenylacetate-CoA ligase [Thiorhodovibrio frisius]